MGQSTRAGSLAAGILASIVSGCAWLCPAPDTPIKTKSETEIAIAAIKAEWMKPCEGLGTQVPDNNIGNLLQDGTDAMSFLAICLRRHNDFVNYLAPVVAKEKSN